MIELTPNSTPEGEQCGTCRFARTHTCAQDRREQVIVRCRRFPPISRERPTEAPCLEAREAATHWPYTTWDDWCGEWQERDPKPDAEPEPMGFRP